MNTTLTDNKYFEFYDIFMILIRALIFNVVNELVK